MPPVKLLPYDFSIHDFEYSSVYGVEKLSGILAHFQLKDDLFDNKQECTKKFDERKNRISNIINNNILGGELSLVISEEYREDYDDFGVDVIEWIEKVRCIRLDEFAAWVKRQKDFKCPQAILDKVQCSKPDLKSNENKGGKPLETLGQAVEYAYLKLREQGNTEVIRPGNSVPFLNCLKEMSTEGNRNLDKYIEERIKEVKIPKNGKYSITTQEREQIKSSRKIVEPSKTYVWNDVSKILTKLRKKYPLTV